MAIAILLEPEKTIFEQKGGAGEDVDYNTSTLTASNWEPNDTMWG